MSSLDEYITLAGAGSACAMSAVGLLNLLDVEWSPSWLHGMLQSVILMFVGLVCLQGETRLFTNYHEVVVENFGFALKHSGRGMVYLLAGLYCIGARYALVQEESASQVEHSSFFGFLWYVCCFVMLLGGAGSLFAWRAQRQMNLLSAHSNDIDAYYISS
mmetsp:Transcript_94127/g.172514  ORF Transcript_94127/g.172514 Transcript_94127/m.172514 type:complete len:160 (-) Transcript_94127:11-490(-)